VRSILGPRNACPLCGHREHSYDQEAGFLVCGRCSELLASDELVRYRTAGTARRYQIANPSSH
jgi:hypothetical protein